MASVFDVANFFIDTVNKTYDDFITNLKLNKLLYYAQGAFLARTERVLFVEHIEAWRLGPVVPEVYRKYSVCGGNPITHVDRDYTSDVFSPDELEVLTDVMREVGQYTGGTLVSMTHKPNTPWSQTARGNRISAGLIKDFFKEHPIPRFNMNNIETVSVLPKDWYDPEEDAEWEEYL